MPEIHPAFDMATATWFITKPRKAEAPSIRALLEKLGPDYTARGYKPVGVAEALVVREPARRIKDDPSRAMRMKPLAPKETR